MINGPVELAGGDLVTLVMSTKRMHSITLCQKVLGGKQTPPALPAFPLGICSFLLIAFDAPFCSKRNLKGNIVSWIARTYPTEVKKSPKNHLSLRKRRQKNKFVYHRKYLRINIFWITEKVYYFVIESRWKTMIEFEKFSVIQSSVKIYPIIRTQLWRCTNERHSHLFTHCSL